MITYEWFVENKMIFSIASMGNKLLMNTLVTWKASTYSQYKKMGT